MKSGILENRLVKPFRWRIVIRIAAQAAPSVAHLEAVDRSRAKGNEISSTCGDHSKSLPDEPNRASQAHA